MPDESIIDDLLDEFEEACQRGEQIDVHRLCNRHPQVADEVLRRIKKLQKMNLKLAGEIAQTPVALTFETQVSDLNFLAKGGLGAVYVGKDIRLNRQVAVKFMHADRAGDLVGRQSFELEAEVTGRLEHPGIIPLYGTGTSDDGVPFYAMRYIDGQTLDATIRDFYAQKALDGKFANIQFRNMLQSFVTICKTIAYAHNRGIVHRDLKPDNIMLGRYGEAIVVDWGLAMPVAREGRFRASGEQTLMPLSGSYSHGSNNGAGTPAYMSPEQASNLAVTPASDIYSLGGTLFKILTGLPPVAGETLDEIRTKILEGSIPKPAELNKSVDSALVAICRKAMALQPQQRYATALELACEIERYLADEPVTAYSESNAEKLSRFFRRHRLATVVALVGLTICFFLAGTSSAWLATANRRERVAHASAEQSRRENLRTSAMFLAKSVAYEIELYWKTLESEAESPTLRQLLMKANAEKANRGRFDSETMEELQRWLEKRFIASGSNVKALAWVINAFDGTQIARVPEAGSIGQNFAHRDYFHALGRDLSAAELAERGQLVPLGNKEVYASSVYLGSNTQTLLITFAVPIWSAPRDQTARERIGVLAFPVELGEFSLGSRAILADTRPDQLRGQAGLILNHPKLGVRGIDDQTPYLAAADLDKASQIAGNRQADSMLNLPRTNILETFFDPVTKQVQLSAIEPVVIRGRKNSGISADRANTSAGSTGWIVIALEEN